MPQAKKQKNTEAVRAELLGMEDLIKHKEDPAPDPKWADEDIREDLEDAIPDFLNDAEPDADDAQEAQFLSETELEKIAGTILTRVAKSAAAAESGNGNSKQELTLLLIVNDDPKGKPGFSQKPTFKLRNPKTLIEAFNGAVEAARSGDHVHGLQITLSTERLGKMDQAGVTHELRRLLLALQGDKLFEKRPEHTAKIQIIIAETAKNRTSLALSVV